MDTSVSARRAYASIPKSVRIGNMTWPIEISDHGDSSMNGEFGHMNLISQKIRIRPGQTPQSLANTVLHECLHAIRWYFGLSTSEHDEEQQTNITANGLCVFFQDNPEAIAWIIKTNKLTS